MRIVRTFGAVGLMTLAVATSAAARPAAGTTAIRVTDATGDSGAAPDIRHVDVGNDVVKGPIVVWVETPNRKKLEGDDLVFVYLDTDLNPATGGTELGIEFFIAGDASGTAGLFRWDGADFVEVPAPTLTWQQRDTWIRMAIAPSDLGGPQAFRWVVVAANGESFDFAPDSGPGPFTLSRGPLVLALDTFGTAPKAPRAGKRFIAAMTIARDDTAELLAEGTVACSASVGGKKVAVKKGWADDVAGCTLVVPRTAKGKLLRLTLTVSYGGKQVTRTYSRKIG